MNYRLALRRGGPLGVWNLWRFRRSFDRLRADVDRAFRESGMTEDEWDADIDRIVAEVRAERRLADSATVSTQEITP